MKTKAKIIEIIHRYTPLSMFACKKLADRLTEPEVGEDVYQPVVDNTTTPPGRPLGAEPQIDSAKVIRVEPQIFKEGNEFPEPREIDNQTKIITEGDIKAAASAYEKIACCEADHPFLKVYVNEDFEAGAKWMQSQ